MARDDYAPSLTPYTREDASHLAETPGVKRLDPGVRVLAVACRDERTGAPRGFGRVTFVDDDGVRRALFIAADDSGGAC